MYTTISKPYHDIMRRVQAQVMKDVPRDNAGAATCGVSCKETLNPRASSIGGDDDDDDEEEEEEYPPYVDPMEEQELCLDPIRALAIPRSRYHTVTELVFCRKGITQLHTNIQLLKNLDTLVVRHNRLRQIAFLIPQCPPREASPATEGMRCAGDSATAAPQNAFRGCRFLRRLYASHNCLQTLDGDVCKLRYLQVLMLAHNRLSNLSAVSAKLKPLRYLQELDLRHNPLCDEAGYRLFLIHEHPQLEVLDRRAVQKEERKEAAACYGSTGCVTRLPPGTIPTTTTTTVETRREILKGEPGTKEEEEESGGRRRRRRKADVEEGEMKSSCRDAAHQDKQAASKAVAFLSTFTPQSKEAGSNTKRHAAIFKPSPCVCLLEKFCRANARKLERKQLEKQTKVDEQQEMRTMRTALHGLWALSGHGMPLSAEKWDALAKSMEASAQASAPPDTLPSPRHRVESHKKFSGSRMHSTEPSTARALVPLVLDPEKLHLPKLTSSVVGQSDYSVLYDCILHRTDLVKSRVCRNCSCLPEDHRLARVKDVLGMTAELLKQQDGLTDARSQQIALMRKIQGQKHALIPEPWEHVTVSSPTPNLPEEEQLKYLYFVAAALLLPTELNALEGQFMADTAESLALQEAQRMKRPAKKDKRRTGEAQQASMNAASQPLPTNTSAASTAMQRLPSIFTASGVQVGPLERSTFLRVLNMLDGESGAWNLSVNLMERAFVADYRRKARETTLVSTCKVVDEERSTSGVGRRARRNPSPLRIKGEGRGMGKLPSGAGEKGSSAVSIVPPGSTKVTTLTLGTMLLDLMRYVPFVESRLAFFRTRCTMTASKGEGGAIGEAAREWFSKLQIASAHIECLMRGMQVAGLTKDAAKTRLVPLESMMMRQAAEVGAFFRARASSPPPSAPS